MYLAYKAADVPLSIHGLQGLVSDRFLAASALWQGPVHVAIFAERLALKTTKIKGSAVLSMALPLALVDFRRDDLLLALFI